MNIFFDLDGTLVDISERNYQVYKNICMRLSGKYLDKSTYWKLKRNRTPIDIILSKTSVHNKDILTFKNNFLKDIEKAKYLKLDKIFSFSQKILDNLHHARHNLFLISFRSSFFLTKSQLIKSDLIKYFTTIRVGRLKSGGPLTKINFMKEIFQRPSGLVVGDTEDDILAAQHLKLISIAVLSGVRNRVNLLKYNPNYLIKDIRALPNILNNINSSTINKNNQFLK